MAQGWGFGDTARLQLGHELLKHRGQAKSGYPTEQKQPYTLTYHYFPISTEEPDMAYAAERNINLTNSSFTTWEEFYTLVAGRCNGAVLHMTPDQVEVFYHLTSAQTEWKELNILPDDFQVSNIKRIVVVED